jgi:uncharacterized membrane protein YbaN (DUF454 family)
MTRPIEPEILSSTAIDEDLRLHDSAWVRWVLLAVGLVSVLLGVIGIVVPIMPTTPFLLVAAACFARASPRFYRWLVTSRTFGPLILEWRRYHSIPWRTKLFAMALFALSLGTSIVLFVRPAWAQGIVALMGLCVLAILYRIPSRDRPARHPGAD